VWVKDPNKFLAGTGTLDKCLGRPGTSMSHSIWMPQVQPKAALVNTVVETDPVTGKHKLRLQEHIVKQTLRSYSKAYVRAEQKGMILEKAETELGGEEKLDRPCIT